MVDDLAPPGKPGKSQPIFRPKQPKRTPMPTNLATFGFERVVLLGKMTV